MKQVLLSFSVLFILITQVKGQGNQTDSLKANLGISFSSFGENVIVNSEDIIGGPSYSGQNFFTFGVNYTYPLRKWLDLETGIEYSEHKLKISPAPGINTPSRSERFSLINIPVTARINFLKYLFVNGGVLIEMDASSSMPINSQTGFGAVLGVGVHYGFKSGVNLFINPYSKFHSLAPFESGNNHQKIFETGVRIGVGFTVR
ncbi:MAG: PorT family protein [Chloroflexia bacterium]|nr:PorT family protein [Bacteroidales bacterium]NJO91027.1 PorT family protein [Chloroflexia bacterium]